MAQPPVIGVRDADPAKLRYGPIVYGLKLLIDGISQASGFSFATVVSVGLAGLFLGAAVMLTAAMVLIRDARPRETPKIEPGTFAAAPPPDQANRQQAPSPAPTGALGPMGPTGGGLAHFDTPPLAGRVEPEAWPPSDQADGSKAGGTTAGKAKRPWPEHKKWNVTGAKYQQFKSGMGKSDMDSMVSEGVKPDAVKEGAGQDGRFTGRMRAASNEYASQIPGAPDLPEGTVLGGQGGASRTGKGGGPVAGPVKQEKIPDVGPGKQLDAAQSPGRPAAGTRAERAGDPPSTAVDVNRITLDPSKANNVDAAPGVNQIGK